MKSVGCLVEMNQKTYFLFGWFGASLTGFLLVFLTPHFVQLNTSCPKANLECPKPEVNTSCPQPECPEPDVSLDCPDCDKGWFKNMIESQEQTHHYKLSEYDCTEFSKELARRLDNKGFDAETKFTTVDCDSGLFETSSCEKTDGGHLVVELENLYIEAVSGEVIDPQNYESYGLKG